MRKILLLISTAAAIVLSSCQKDVIISNPTIDNAVVINVPQSSWTYMDQGSNCYFFATVEMPEITEYAFDMGVIKTYRAFNYSSKDAYQIELPYVLPHEYPIDGREGTDWLFYTETIECEIAIGQIRFIYRVSDFDYELDETFIPEAMTFRCVVMYN